jgi:hypothetical protein
MEMKMANYPETIATQHPWASDVVGGSYGEPILIKLQETELISNGAFDDALVGWDGGGTRQDFGEVAMVGNYVLAMENIAYMHTYFDRTSADTGNEMDLMLFAGFIKATAGGANKTVKIKIYCDNGTARVASPTDYIIETINLDNVSIVADADGLSQWIRFYICADVTGYTGNYIHFEIYSTDYATVNYYLDDLKVYEVKEVVELECPNSLRLKWERKTDANYEMVDGTDKDYVRGWRPIYAMQYEFCTRAQMVKNIGITESDFNFLIPQKDNLNGDFVRMIEDLSANYFHDKFLGHDTALILRGIYLRKFKNIEYGGIYFTITAT